MKDNAGIPMISEAIRLSVFNWEGLSTEYPTKIVRTKKIIARKN